MKVWASFSVPCASCFPPLNFKHREVIIVFLSLAISEGGGYSDSQTDSVGTWRNTLAGTISVNAWELSSGILNLGFREKWASLFFLLHCWMIASQIIFLQKNALKVLLVSAFPRVKVSLWSLRPRTTNQELRYTHGGKHSDVCFRPGETTLDTLS